MTRVTLAGLALLVGVLWSLPALAADAPPATTEQLAALDAILARPEFQAAEGRSVLDRLLDPIRAWLRWLGWEVLRWLAWLVQPAADMGGQAFLLVVVAMALVIVIGAALMARRLLHGSLAGDAALGDVRGDGPPRADAELAQARALAEAGDTRRAVHHLYRAVLLRLNERDHLPFDGTLTNRELVPRLTAAPTLAAPFAELVARFDRLWYGQTGCSPEEYAAFAELAERVWQAAEALSPTRPGSAVTARTAVTAGASSGAR